MRLRKVDGQYVLAPCTSDEGKALDALVTQLVSLQPVSAGSTNRSQPSAPILRVVESGG